MKKFISCALFAFLPFHAVFGNPHLTIQKANNLFQNGQLPTTEDLYPVWLGGCFGMGGGKKLTGALLQMTPNASYFEVLSAQTVDPVKGESISDEELKHLSFLFARYTANNEPYCHSKIIGQSLVSMRVDEGPSCGEAWNLRRSGDLLLAKFIGFGETVCYFYKKL